MGETETVAGEVTAVIYADQVNGFGVVEIDAAGEGELRAAGPLAGLQPGQAVRLAGRWADHPRYGPTFEADFYETAPPRSPEALAAFLASERFKGVGDVLAHRLVEAFGLELPTIAVEDPDRLAKVHGVSTALAARISRTWRDAGALAELVQRLGAAGVSPRLAHLAQRRFGEEVLTILDEDPYRLLDVRGIRWAHVEALGRSAGIDLLDPRRLAAGALTVQRELCAKGGHMAAVTDDLVPAASRLLGLDALDARRALDAAAAAGALTEEDGWWYTPRDLAVERGLADDLGRLLEAESRVAAAAGDADVAGDLTDEQAAAVRVALTTPVSVLTGGPGTGKTRTIIEIARVCEEAGLQLALCAPTGRAAKRMEELCGRPAATVHRLLEAHPAPDGGFRFGYGTLRRLPHDLIVADEWSMADTFLAASLAAAVSDGAHLVLVGDPDQLPSVGAGAVLRDLLDPVSPVPATRLTTIHRQAAASRIVTLAHQVNAGDAPVPAGRMGDVFAVPERTAAVADRVAEIVAARAPDFFGCRPADVQVLAPMYRGPAGVDRLNARLKERLNPAAGRRAVAGFHEGDRVVQTRNDAELDVANGDIGEVVATDPSGALVEVAFPPRVVRYEGDQAADLAPAWCLTVHKAQGGEWPVVVLVLDPGHRVMLWRELVYTAITRAAEGLLLVGDPGLVSPAARRTGSGARSRRTRLTQRLASAAGAPTG